MSRYITRLEEGQVVPTGYRVTQVFSTEEVLVGPGTNMKRVYLVELARDLSTDRYPRRSAEDVGTAA